MCINDWFRAGGAKPVDPTCETDMQSTETIVTILVAVIAVVGVVQLVIFFAMLFALRKAAKAAEEHAVELKVKILPLLDQTRELAETAKNLLTRVEPRIEAVAIDIAEITRTATLETKKISESVDEMRERMRRQAERVDGMTTSALNGVDRFGQFMNYAASVPMRQVSGIVAAARAVVETLRKPAPPQHGAHVPMTPREEPIREERSSSVR